MENANYKLTEIKHNNKSKLGNNHCLSCGYIPEEEHSDLSNWFRIIDKHHNCKYDVFICYDCEYDYASDSLIKVVMCLLKSELEECASASLSA